MQLAEWKRLGGVNLHMKQVIRKIAVHSKIWNWNGLLLSFMFYMDLSRFSSLFFPPFIFFLRGEGSLMGSISVHLQGLICIINTS